MATIEIHGLDEIESLKTREKIFKLIKESVPDLLDDIIVSYYNDHCVDHKGFVKPFLRIYCYDQRHFKLLFDALNHLHMTIEPVCL